MKGGMINLHTLLSHHFLYVPVELIGYTTYRRTPHRMTSRSQWLPLNAIVIIHSLRNSGRITCRTAAG